MKVYVAERGCYENRHVAGIFDSPERAMARFKGTWKRTWWERERYEEWSNDLDWDDTVRITAVEVVVSGDIAEPAPAEALVWASDRGPLNEIPLSHEAAEAIANTYRPAAALAPQGEKETH